MNINIFNLRARVAIPGSFEASIFLFLILLFSSLSWTSVLFFLLWLLFIRLCRGFIGESVGNNFSTGESVLGFLDGTDGCTSSSFNKSSICISGCRGWLLLKTVLGFVTGFRIVGRLRNVLGFGIGRWWQKNVLGFGIGGWTVEVDTAGGIEWRFVVCIGDMGSGGLYT